MVKHIIAVWFHQGGRGRKEKMKLHAYITKINPLKYNNNHPQNN